MNLLKSKRLLCCGFLLALAIVSCDNRSKINFEGEEREEQAAFSLARAEQPPQNISVTERKLLKEGSINFETADTKETHTFISTLCKEFAAYISSESQNNYQKRLVRNVTVRVPTDRFDAFVARLEKHALKVEDKNISVKDVTEEFIDLEARHKTKRELETRYLELLKQAKTVQDVIAVESELNTVRADIESMQGRLKYLQDRVSFSTLNISFYESIGVDFGFGYKFTEALGHGWDNFLIFTIGLIYIWPFILLGCLAIYFFIRWRKRRLRNKPEVSN